MELDYGGGKGLTAALMRRAGWAYDTYDPYGSVDMAPERAGRYDFCSAFEVFEHSPDPVYSLQDIVQRVSSGRLMVLISTALHDSEVSAKTRLAWWYAAPRNGHVSLYSARSMHILAEKVGLRYTPIRGMNGTHLLSRGVSEGQAQRFLLRGKAIAKLRNTLRR